MVKSKCEAKRIKWRKRRGLPANVSFECSGLRIVEVAIFTNWLWLDGE